MFPFTPPASRRSKPQFTDYYFWSLEQFSTKLSFICEGKQADIGCIEVGEENIFMEPKIFLI